MMNWQFLLDISVKATIILASAGLLILVRKNSSAAARHLWWSLALSSLLLLPLCMLVMPSIQAPILPAPSATPRPAFSNFAAIETMDDLATLPASRLINTGNALRQNNDSEAKLTAPGNQLRFDWTQAILVIWCTGALLMLLRLVWGSWKINGIVHDSAIVTDYSFTTLVRNLSTQLNLYSHVELRLSTEISMPVTYGVTRAIILLPVEAVEWSADWMRIVLLHELAHIKRRDCLTQMLANFVCALYWFNPLVWWAARQLRTERELACDDCVLAAGTRASDYAGYLVALAKTFDGAGQTTLVTVGMACSHLENRVRAILNPTVNRQLLAPRKIAFLTIIVFSLVLPLSSLQATSQEQKIAPRAAETAALVLAAKQEIGTDEMALLQTEIAQAQPELAEQIEKLAQQKEKLFALQRKAEDKKLSPAEAQELATVQKNIVAIQTELKGKLVLAGVDDSLPPLAALAPGAAPALLSPLDEITALPMPAPQSIPAPNPQPFPAPALAPINSEVAPALAIVSGAVRTGQETQQKADENKLTPDVLVQLKIHDITPEYMEAVRKFGFENLTIRQIIELKNHDISEAYIKEAQSWSNEKLSLREIVQLKISGVKPEYINAMKQAGYGNISVRKLAQMRLHEVTPEFANAMKQVGFDNLSADQLTQMKIHGITPEYIKQVQGWGLGKLSVSDLMQLKIHNVSPDDARALKALGFDNISLQDLTRIKIHGVTENYVKEMRALGFDNLTLEQLIRMKTHGVDAEYVKKMRAAGFKNISTNDLLKMKIQGIDSILLKN